MKRFIFVIIILTTTALSFGSNTIILSSLSSLYYTRNPIDNLFKTSWFELEAFYRPYGEDYSYQNVSLTIRLPFNYFAVALTASYGKDNLFEKIQNNEIEWSNTLKETEFYINASMQLSAFIVAVTIPSFNVNLEENEIQVSDNKVKIAIGLGSVKLDADYRSYTPRLVKKGGAALYYINDDIISIENNSVVVNDRVDWFNGKVGLFADAEGYSGRVILDIGYDLRGIETLESEEPEENDVLKYAYATLEIEGKPLIMGATYDGSGFLLSGGLNLFGTLKGWIEVVFDHEFNMQGIGAFAQLHF